VRTGLHLGPLLGVALAGALLPVLPASAAGAPAAGSVPGVAWQPCADQPTVDCGTLRVPLDWKRPGAAKVGLGLARHVARDPAHRVGTVFVNPGGPGGSGVEITKFADLVFTPQLNARFDIVGIDPRGVAASTPVTCTTELSPPGYTLFPRSEQQFDQMVAHNRAVGQSCLHGTGPLLGHVDTVSAARDIEAVRQALGLSTVNFLGLSYGTQLYANYAELYPHRVRAMALDAALEHSLADVTMLADEISAAEDSFNRFAAWCRATPTCALYGQDVGRVYDDLVVAADRRPIPTAGAVRPVSGEDIRLNTQDKLLFPQATVFGGGWPALATAIAGLRAGDATAFATPPAASHTDFRYAALAIGCMDWRSEIHNYGEMQQRIELGRQLAPHLQGAVQTWTLARCIGWPVDTANPVRRLDVRGAPTILIINATHDPSTPYEWAHGLVAQIRGSALLTRVGDGHTSYLANACAQAVIDRYLVEARSAGPNQVCTG
jgi:pimeloyl-ACP methyl ester carboxylesterase